MDTEDRIGDSLPIQYEKMSFSTSSRTQTGSQSARTHFDKFLMSKKLPSSRDIDEARAFRIELFDEFCTYLSDFARSKGGKSALKMGTAKQYFSGAKNIMKRRFPNSTFWNDKKVEQSFTDLLKRMERKMGRVSMGKGERVRIKPKAMYR